MVDWVPGLSQVKSVFQMVCLDFKGALKTQENFVTKCPGVAHVVGTTAVIAGGITGHKQTLQYGIKAFEDGNKTISDVADGTPIIGHVKSGVHLVFGDTEGAAKAFISATRSAAVMGGGAVGFVLGGPVGSVYGGLTVGGTIDGISSAQGERRGVFALADVKTPGDLFDVVSAVVSDGLTGYTGGKYADRALRANQIDAFENVLDKRKEAVDVGPKKQVAKIEVYSEVTDLETGKKYYGTNKSIRNKVKINGRAEPVNNVFVEQNPIEGRLPKPRSAAACAEMQAYDQLLRDNPNAQTSNTIVHTFLHKEGKWKNMQTCENCDARAHRMGDIATNPKKGGFYINLDVPDHMPSEFYEHQILHEPEFYAKERNISTRAEFNSKITKASLSAKALRKKAKECDDDEDDED